MKSVGNDLEGQFDNVERVSQQGIRGGQPHSASAGGLT